MKIIPAIDIMNGQCVRLSQGDFDKKKIYNSNPLEVAQSFEEAGLQYLHVVDLDGAKAGRVKHWDIIESIVEKTKLKVDFGGGIKTEKEVAKLLDMGVQQINLGSIAFNEPVQVKFWIKKYGSERIILSADSNNEKLAISGWLDQTKITVIEFIREFMDAGLTFATCTDISKDGMMGGANIDLYKKLLMTFPELNLIASGGVNSLDDLNKISKIGCYGCIVGKAIYEGTIPLKQLARFPKK
jgi:phosphoribosylformimino-5-aminoimidazole carboxamide ribotide isomerase